MCPEAKTKVVTAGLLGLALLLVPAPMIPPDWLAQEVQSLLSLDWKPAYFAAAIGLQVLLYTALGVLAALTLNRAPTLGIRLLQIAIAPAIVVGVAFLLRSLKLGHPPMLANALVPILACFLGVALGIGVLYRRLKIAVLVMTALIAVVVCGGWVRISSNLSRQTQASLQSLVSASPRLPHGDARFGAAVQSTFTTAPGPQSGSVVDQNRGAILALGIALGHEELARCIGLDQRSELIRNAVAVRSGSTLHGREDWSRHYALSAALAVLGHPLLSDAGGLIKEQLDALARGSGFSFGDLAADRAGIRFAEIATRSETDAKAMQARLQTGFVIDDFFPSITDLPENLTVEEFRARYGAAGSERFREQIAVIEQRLNRCAAFSGPH